jgi:WS/DGAT/MGAT family acyltransferase
VADRLSSLDVSFLYLETPTTPMHVGSVAIFDRPADFDYDAFVEIVRERIGQVPRYRQRVRWVPGHLANPVWVDAADFDLSYHVRRSGLPKPGSEEQLRELVGRVISRRLDRARPLWELYVVEGLSAGRMAIITKTHHAIADGIRAVDIGTVLLDTQPRPRPGALDDWVPHREPDALELVVEAAADALRRPAQVLDNVRGEIADVRAIAGNLAGAAGGVISALRTAARPAPSSPLNAGIGEQRRFGTATTDLDDYKRVRKAHGGTVNDVVLATVAGALRSWLLTRGEPVTTQRTARAMVPVSVRDDEAGAAFLGNRLSSFFVDLPVGEPNPVLRLHQVAHAMQAHKDSGQSVAADTIITLSGFAPPTIHLSAARLASTLSRRLFNLVVTNVPGPQIPLYAAGARMRAAFPVVPLAKGQALSIGLISYNGRVCYGLTADRDVMPDVDVLAGCLSEALDELVQTV